MKLPLCYETEIYVGASGYLIFVQLKSNMALQPVLLSPDQAKKLLEKLPSMIADQETVWGKEKND